MRFKIRKIIAITLIFIGILIVVFPYICNEITDTKMQEKIIEFKQISKTERHTNELYQRLEEYNKRLYKNGQELVDAFSYQDVSVDLTEYGYLENIIGTLKISKIDVELPIYLGATEENLLKGAVHLSHTSLPIGGNNTNSVIAAHRGLIRNKMFKNIDMLEVGDEVIITNSWNELLYKVKEIKIIEPSDVSQVYIQENRDLITLMTCHPYRINTHRYVVICEREKLNIDKTGLDQ